MFRSIYTIALYMLQFIFAHTDHQLSIVNLVFHFQLLMNGNDDGWMWDENRLISTVCIHVCAQWEWNGTTRTILIEWWIESGIKLNRSLSVSIDICKLKMDAIGLLNLCLFSVCRFSMASFSGILYSLSISLSLSLSLPFTIFYILFNTTPMYHYHIQSAESVGFHSTTSIDLFWP